jgi:filamentous hemagglutinin family protein
MHRGAKLCGVLAAALIHAAAFAVNSRAQIVLDGTLGPQGPLAGPDYRIGADLGQQRGGNLFHSFSDFNLSPNESATFSGPPSVDNVIGRVTGGNGSFIDGRLASDIPGANLFLINPSGVVFGPHAALDVQGSFAVSTADTVLLGSDGRFDATRPENSVLGVAPPSAFGFLAADPAPIRFEGSRLEVPESGALTVVGGEVQIRDATLRAPSGRVEIVSAAAPGDVVRGADGLDTTGVGGFGAVEISGRPEARLRVGEREIGNLDASGSGGGRVFIRGGRLVTDGALISTDSDGAADGARVDIDVDGAVEMRAGSAVRARTFAGADAGELTVRADAIDLRDGSRFDTTTFAAGKGADVRIAARTISFDGDRLTADGEVEESGIFARAFATGDTGSVSVAAAEDVKMTGGAKISISTRAEGADAGDAGRLEVRAGTISLSGENRDGLPTAIFNDAEGDGNAGPSFFTAEMLSLTGGAQIQSSSAGVGRGGDTTIIAGTVSVAGENSRFDIPSNIGTASRGAGDAGNIFMEVDTLRLVDTGGIAVTGFAGGRAGNVTIRAAGSVEITGTDSSGRFASGIFAAVLGDGDGGTISITAPRLVMDQGTIDGGVGDEATGKASRIELDVGELTMRNRADIFSTSFGAGEGGEIDVRAGSLFIADRGSGLFSRAEGSGNGGSIRVVADDVRLENGASITTESVSQTSDAGDAGNIDIVVGGDLRLSDASITTAAAQAFGGSIAIEAGSLIDLQRSAIATSVLSGVGDGGNVTIEARFLVLDQSRVVAQADVGNGGNIAIDTEVFLASPDSIVDASSNAGIDGIVAINSPDANFTESLATLPSSFLDVDALLPQRCARAGDSGTFVIHGAAGIPPRPGACP